MYKTLFLFIFISSSFLISQESKLYNDSYYDSRSISSVKQKLEEVPLDIKNSCESFFKSIIERKFEDAFKNIIKNSYINQKEEQLKTLISQSKQTFTLYGEMKEFEFINSEKSSSSLYKIRYLGKHIDYPTRWIFTFYNSPKYGWILINLKFDDLVDFLFIAD